MPVTSKRQGRTAWALRTYPEIAETAESDGSVLVLPVGSVEQHGYHLPVATDTILVEEIATLGVERVADEVPVLTLPPVWAGFSPHHVEFGGTVTVSFERLLHHVEDVVDSATSYGFDAVLLVNGHGGNNALISTAVNTLGVTHPNLEVLGVTYFALAAPFIDDVRESGTGGMAHGGEFETSLMLHFRPDLVRESEFDATIRDEPYDHAGREMFDGGPLSVYRPYSTYSDVGALGDPESASAEKGAAITDLLAEELEQLLQQVHEEVRP
jgi:creatinine amidohydrolase